MTWHSLRFTLVNLQCNYKAFQYEVACIVHVKYKTKLWQHSLPNRYISILVLILKKNNSACLVLLSTILTFMVYVPLRNYSLAYLWFIYTQMIKAFYKWFADVTICLQWILHWSNLVTWHLCLSVDYKCMISVFYCWIIGDGLTVARVELATYSVVLVGAVLCWLQLLSAGNERRQHWRHLRHTEAVCVDIEERWRSWSSHSLHPCLGKLYCRRM